MLHNSDFHEDLRFGQGGEDLIRDFIVNVINQGLKTSRYSITDIRYDSLWDFEITKYPLREDGSPDIMYIEGSKLHIEVKTDKYKHKTNNIFIELSSKGRKSGLSTTKSHYYVYFFIRKDLYQKDNVLIIETSKLRSLVNKYMTHVRYGGDNNSVLGVTLPLSEVKQYFKALTFREYNIDQSEQKTPKMTSFKKKDMFD